MPRRIAVIDGHPDPDPARYIHALARTYAEGARDGGHEIRIIRLADLDVPFLRSQAAWSKDPPPADIAGAQQTIAWAEHLVILYPLWLGSMPALLKAFLEQAFRPGFAIGREHSLSPGLLMGRSVRIVVTMGMPAPIYRWFFFAHSLKALERNILRYVGLGPIRTTLIGGVGALSEAQRADWQARLKQLGRSGA